MESITTGLIINEVTTCIVALLFFLVAMIYKYLMNIAPTETSQRIYRYLFTAWIFFTLTYVLLFIRNLIMDETLNIWINKIDTALTAIGALFLYVFMGELFGTSKAKKIFTILGIGEAIIATAVYVGWPSFTTETSDYGVEVIPPQEVLIIVLALILLIIVLFVFTAIYLGMRTEKPELKRRITLVSTCYSIWWVFQLIEAGGILVTMLGGVGMIITRAILSILAFVIIYVWAGRTKFVEALKSIMHL